jgi:hypothetical protein
MGNGTKGRILEFIDGYFQDCCNATNSKMRKVPCGG